MIDDSCVARKANKETSTDPDILACMLRIKEDLEKQPKHLPEWPAGKRGAPNEILRSALFCAKNRNTPRPYLKDIEVAVIGEGRILYRGEELRQDDELVWLHLVHLGKGTPLGQCVEFSPYSFIKAIGWPTNGGGYEHLRICISRMVATAVKFTSKRLHGTVAISMIRKCEFYDSVTSVPLRHWQIWLEPEMQILFSDHSYTLIDLNCRKRLPDGIASKLHSYWSSHRDPYPVRVETLQKLCGSMMDLKHFKAKLSSALDQLVKIGFLSKWTVAGNLVTVIREKDKTVRL